MKVFISVLNNVNFSILRMFTEQLFQRVHAEDAKALSMHVSPKITNKTLPFDGGVPALISKRDSVQHVSNMTFEFGLVLKMHRFSYLSHYWILWICKSISFIVSFLFYIWNNLLEVVFTGEQWRYILQR